MVDFKVHPHEQVIKQWLQGEKIQCKLPSDTGWYDVNGYPCWYLSMMYRVKPKEPEGTIKYVFTRIGKDGLHWVFTDLENANLKITYDPFGHLKDVSLT